MPAKKPSVPDNVLFVKYAFIAVALVMAVLAYVNALPNGFVYDDEAQVLDNLWIRDVKQIPEIFLSDVWGFEKSFPVSNYYRPVMHIIYMLDYYVFGLKPWGFHLVNILFHSANTLLVFLITSLFFTKIQLKDEDYYFFSFAAAIIFATHPVHTEAVTWIGGIPELSFTFFYLLSFYFYIRAEKVLSKEFISSVLFYFLSTISKETALTLPMILLVYDFSIRKNTKASFKCSPFRVSEIIKRYLPFFMATLLYLAIRINALGSFAPQKIHSNLNGYECFINIFPLIAQYAGKLLFPVNLNVFHVFNPMHSIFESRGILSFLLVLFFASMIYISWRKNRIVFISLMWMFISILPALYIPALGENIFTERYLYLPSAGLAILSATAIWNICKGVIEKKRCFYASISIFLLTAIFYSTTTFKRNYTWRNGYTLWSDAVMKSPGAWIARNNLGKVFYDGGRIGEGEREFKIAISLKPDYSLAHKNLGTINYDKGRFKDAAMEYMTAIKYAPRFLDAYIGAGNTFYKMNMTEDALREYENAIRINPSCAEAYNNIGDIYYDRENFYEAAKQYRTAIKLKPEFIDPHIGLGDILYYQNKFDEAIREYQYVLRINPDYAQVHYNLGMAYNSKGLKEEAVKEFRISQKLNPKFLNGQEAMKSILKEEK